MPTNLVGRGKRYSEKAWGQAKDIASKSLDKPGSGASDAEKSKYWATVNIITKNIQGKHGRKGRPAGRHTADMKTAALRDAFISGLVDRLREKHAQTGDPRADKLLQIVGDSARDEHRTADVATKTLQAAGDVAKFGPLAASRIVTAPLSLPANILDSAGHAGAVRKRILDDPTARPGTYGVKDVLKIMTGMAGEHSAKRVTDILREHLSARQLQGVARRLPKPDRTRTAGKLTSILSTIAGVLNPYSLVVGPISALAGGNRPAERLAEGLRGEKPGILRRWFDPGGAAGMSIGQSIGSTSPGVAAQLLQKLVRAQNGGVS